MYAVDGGDAFFILLLGDLTLLPRATFSHMVNFSL